MLEFLLHFQMNLPYMLHIVLLWAFWGSDHQTTALKYSNLKGYIYSPHLTTWGTWGDWAMCKTGHFVVGVSLQVQGQQGKGDDTALNSIHLRCESPNQQKSYMINSKDGFWGDWTPYTRCPGTGKGFQLRSEPNQGKDDDTAAVDFQLLCLSDGKESFVGKSGLLDWGEWTAVERCPSGRALCGIQTQVEDKLASGDNTALNNVNMACSKT